MIAIRVFDPAMCCSTGICGPSVDPRLPRFAADLDFVTKGEAGLPLVKVNGEVKSSGAYPSRDELAGWAGVSAPVPEPNAKSAGCGIRSSPTSCS